MKQKLRVYMRLTNAPILVVLKRLSLSIVWFIIGLLLYNFVIKSFLHFEGLEYLLLFFVLWLVFAYLIIPFIHRILTKFYVPDYFIGRIRTSDGLLGDPVNLALIGSEKQIHIAMKNAGWTLADKITIKTSIKTIYSYLFKKIYHNEPVSSAYLFNKVQSFAYQQKIENKLFARHHVRFWKVPIGWLMPGGYKVDWIAAGTYDRSVGFSYSNLQLTHHISPDTDSERDFIIKTLNDSKSFKEIDIHKNYFSAYHHRNGGGDSINTDGSLPIIKL